MTIGYDKIAVMCTAHRRPEYLRRVLTGWASARHAGEIAGFMIALGRSGQQDEQIRVIRETLVTPGVLRHVVVRPDSDAAAVSIAMHRAIGEAGRAAFETFSAEFVIFTEEDVLPGDDILEYFQAMATRFQDDPRCLLVNGHDPGGQGWDVPGIGAQNPGADPAVVRRMSYFNAWAWGCWPDRWYQCLEPAWDWNQDTGSDPMKRGYDWNIQERIMPAMGMYSVTPDASRTQNIGEHGGFYAKPELFDATQSASFREHREPGIVYELNG